MAFMPGMGPDQIPPNWSPQPVSGLGGLAQGLRLAGGILSPQVFRTVAEEDQRREQQAQTQRLLEIQQTVRGIETGAINPEAGQMRLQQLGFRAPVGPGIEAQAKTERVQQQMKMREAMAKLPPDASFEDRLIAMAPHMEPQQQIAAFTAVEGKREQLETRKQQITLEHEARMARLDNDQARAAETARHNAAMETMRAEGINLRRMGGAFGRSQGRAPMGYRWTEGGELEPIPGGPKDETARPDKPLPISAAQKLMENQQNLRRAEDALALIKGEKEGGDKAATGLKGYLPEAMLQRADPKGVQTRAAIGDLGSLVIHDRSGAAVTAAEFPRLRPFIPLVTDNAATVEKKLARFVQVYRDVVTEAADFYRESGYKVPTGALRSGNAPADGPARVTSDADYEALPSGTTFIGPDGKTRRKP